MISKLFILCILGIFVRNAYSQFETMHINDIKSLYLGNNSVRQLICASDEVDLCDKYGIKSVTAENTKYPIGVSWKYNISTLPSFIKSDKLQIKCDNSSETTDLGSQLIIKDSCKLSYVLKSNFVRMPTYLRLGSHKLTGGRQPVQQLRCVGGEICNLVNVTYAVCFSKEIAGSNDWSCEHKELPKFVDFDNISVACENSNFGDEVIENSCHLNYSLKVLTQRLDSIQSLVLYKNNRTVGFEKLQQLTCVGDKNLCDEYSLLKVDCKTVGYRNGNVEWKCSDTRTLGNNVTFNSTNVSCEDAPGFKHTDNVIIENSCRLSYSLKKIEKEAIGRRERTRIKLFPPVTTQHYIPPPPKRDNNVRVGLYIAIFVGIIALGVVVIILSIKCAGGSRRHATGYSNPFHTVTYAAAPYHNDNVNIVYCVDDFHMNNNHNCGGNDFVIGDDYANISIEMNE